MNQPTRNACGVVILAATSLQAKALAHRFLAYLPDEPVKVEMKEGGRGYEPKESALNSLLVDPIRKQFDIPVCKHHADVQPDHQPTSPEQEAHEWTHMTSSIDALPIVDPHNGQVLHVVKYLEQSNADYDIGDAHHRIPPEAEADSHHPQLTRAGRLTRPPLPQSIC